MTRAWRAFCFMACAAAPQCHVRKCTLVTAGPVPRHPERLFGVWVSAWAWARLRSFPRWGAYSWNSIATELTETCRRAQPAPSAALRLELHWVCLDGSPGFSRWNTCEAEGQHKLKGATQEQSKCRFHRIRLRLAPKFSDALVLLGRERLETTLTTRNKRSCEAMSTDSGGRVL